MLLNLFVSPSQIMLQPVGALRFVVAEGPVAAADAGVAMRGEVVADDVERLGGPAGPQGLLSNSRNSIQRLQSWIR